MKEIFTEMHRFIFERSLNLFDWWYITVIGSLATEYSAWFFLLLIPCVYISVTEYRKL